MPSFIKMDFSEMPALIAAFSIGPWSGVAVCLIKNLINLPMTTTGCVGELANFLLGAAFVLPAGYVYHVHRTKKAALWSSCAGAGIMAIIGLPINYYLTYPIYAKILPIDAIVGMYQAIIPSVDGLFMCLLVFNLPFTLLKGLLDTAITFLIYKRISPLIKGT
jgi:riboflavin transporter FmnP